MENSRKFVALVVLVVLGVAIAMGGAEIIALLTLAYPSHAEMIRQIGGWVIGFGVSLLAVYPIFVIFGLVRPTRLRWRRKSK